MNHIGYFIILLDDKKRGIHDRLSDTRVVYEERVNNEPERKQYVGLVQNKQEADINDEASELEEVQDMDENIENELENQDVEESLNGEEQIVDDVEEEITEEVEEEISEVEVPKVEEDFEVIE